MSKFTVHVPAFIDNREPPESFEFNNVLDFYNIPWIHKAVLRGDKICRDSTNMIVSVSECGKKWWVEGYVSDFQHLNLDDWVKHRKE